MRTSVPGTNRGHSDTPFLETEYELYMLSRAPRTVLGAVVHRVPSAPGPIGSCPWSGCAGAVSLTPRATWPGLDGPMPRTITPVMRGRCHPTPDRVPQGAPTDRHRSGGVSGSPSFLTVQWLLPVLGAPLRGVGRIHGDDRDPVASAIEVRRARSLPIGIPEMTCRNRFLRPCFSRVLEVVNYLWLRPRACG